MIEFLFVIAFAVHLLAVNTAAAGPLIAAALEWRGTRTGDAAYTSLGRRMARLSLSSFFVGVLLGAALLVVLWRTDRG